MIKYEVKEIVCDYGVCEDGKLIPQLILNSRHNAELIRTILEADQRHEVFNVIQTSNNTTY